MAGKFRSSTGEELRRYSARHDNRFRRLALAAAVAVRQPSPPLLREPGRPPLRPTSRPSSPPPGPRARRVEGRDADTTIYLFGTVHALPPDVDWFDGAVAVAFDGSQELVTEIVETDPAEMQGVGAHQGHVAAGQDAARAC